MIVLTGVNFASKENMYKEIKQYLIKFIGDLAEGKARTRLDINLKPAWRKSFSSSNRTEHVQRCNSGCVKNKLNPLGADGKVLLCNLCGSYRHLVAECQDSLETL